MKNLFFILFSLLSIFTFGQSKQEVKSEILKLRKQGDYLHKGLNDGFYCKKYFSEWHNYNYRKLYTYSPPKTVDEVETIIKRYQSDINFLENLKKDYIRPNGALSKYNSDASKLKIILDNVRKLEKSIDEYPYPLVWQYNGNCKNVIESIDNKIRTLNGFLRSKQSLKQELENNASKNSNSSNNSYNSNNYNTNTSSNNNYNSTNTNNNSNNQNRENETYGEKQQRLRNEHAKKLARERQVWANKQEAKRIATNKLAQQGTDLVNLVIASGIFKSDPKAKAKRKKAREERNELWDNYYETKRIRNESNKNSTLSSEITSKFSEGLAVKKNSKGFFGFINEDNKWIIKPKFLDAKPFKEGKAIVTTKFGKIIIINKKGKKI